MRTTTMDDGDYLPETEEPRGWKLPRGAMIVRVALAALVVIAGDWLFWQQEAFGTGIGAFAAIVALVAVIARPAIVGNWTGRVSWLAAMLFAAAMIFEPSLIGWLAFGVSLGIAILSPRTAGFGDAWQWAQRIIWQTMTAPFLPLLDLLRMRRAQRKRGQMLARFSLRRALGTLVLPVTGAGVFLMLFATANPVIAGWFDDFGFKGLFDLLNPFRWFVAGLWLLTAWNAMRPRMARRVLPGFDGTGDARIPGVTVASVTLSLLTFNAIFALQNAMDIAWLWGFAELPEGMTLAAYAHRGAYPLILTALLAGLFVLITLRPGSSTNAVPLIRGLVTLWVMQNIVLVASSMLRTWDYVEAYSLTILRLAALEWMALVALGLGFILWRLWSGQNGRWLINANAATAALVLGAATMVDHGAIVARWNVDHAREVDGSGAGLDLCYLNRLGGASILPLLELEARDGLDPALRERVIAVRRRLMEQLIATEDSADSNAWTLRGRVRLAQARAILAQRDPIAIAPVDRNCDGSVMRAQPVPTAAALAWAAADAADASAASATNVAEDAATRASPPVADGAATPKPPLTAERWP
jgi:hypothetical protein